MHRLVRISSNLAALAAAVLLPTSVDGQARVNRLADSPAGLVLLTPPERAAAPLPRFSALMNHERVLPLTPQQAANVRFDAKLTPVTPPLPLLRSQNREPTPRLRIQPLPPARPPKTDEL